MGSEFGVGALVRVVVDRGGRVRGYVVVDDTDQRVRAAEIGGRGEGVFGTILHYLARRAVRLRLQEISLSLPVDHPFARYGRLFGCRATTHFHRNAGAMGRIIDLERFLGRVLPVLGTRWGEEDRDVALGISTDAGETVLSWDGDRLTSSRQTAPTARLKIPQDALMVLMLGYQDPVELLEMGKGTATRSVLPLLRRLFPIQHAHMWWPDRF